MYVQHANLLSITDRGQTAKQIREIENKVEEKVKSEARDWLGNVSEENVRLKSSLIEAHARMEKLEKRIEEERDTGRRWSDAIENRWEDKLNRLSDLLQQVLPLTTHPEDPVTKAVALDHSESEGLLNVLKI
jgi:type I site-specific restriction endonuclease